MSPKRRTPGLAGPGAHIAAAAKQHDIGKIIAFPVRPTGGCISHDATDHFEEAERCFAAARHNLEHGLGDQPGCGHAIALLLGRGQLHLLVARQIAQVAK